MCNFAQKCHLQFALIVASGFKNGNSNNRVGPLAAEKEIPI